MVLIIQAWQAVKGGKKRAGLACNVFASNILILREREREREREKSGKAKL
jgi:hypothetical protein